MQSYDLSHHISRRFDEELKLIRTRVLAMGGLTEQQLQKAVAALLTRNTALGDAVAVEDYQVNEMEMAIDEECNRILAMRGPTAGDLRVVLTMMRTVTDLERIGDEAQKIGNIARVVNSDLPADHYNELKQLCQVVVEMFRDSLDAFARVDARAALHVARRDGVVDKEYELIQRQCITSMMSDPRSIRCALDLLWVVRALERIGDHAKNICESVIYMTHGKDVRHVSLDEMEKSIEAAPDAGLPEHDWMVLTASAHPGKGPS